MTEGGNVSISVFGAAPDTGNLGVSARLYGALGCLGERIEGLSSTVFDFGAGVRKKFIGCWSQGLKVSRCRNRHTRRLHRPGSLTRKSVTVRLGGLRAARSILDAVGILDLSGGDSFTNSRLTDGRT